MLRISFGLVCKWQFYNFTLGVLSKVYIVTFLIQERHMFKRSSVWRRHCSLQWRHNDRDGVSNHQPSNCSLNRLFRHRSKKTSKLRVTGLCAWNSPMTGESPAQRASSVEIVSIWWRHLVNGRSVQTYMPPLYIRHVYVVIFSFIEISSLWLLQNGWCSKMAHGDLV